jgi:hypothetical protein
MTICQDVADPETHLKITQRDARQTLEQKPQSLDTKELAQASGVSSRDGSRF